MGKKQTRFFARWRIDQDYVHRLPPAALAWLEKFNGEYYRAEFTGHPLHGVGDARRDLYRAQNAAAADLVTAPSPEVLEATTRPIARASDAGRYYTPADYRMLAQPAPQSQLEDELVAMVETGEIPRALVDEALEMIDEGADIVDVLEALGRGHRRAG